MVVNAIQLEKLTKIYSDSFGKEGKLALDHVDLEIPQGCIFGLLGPNGAGKSTMINILAGTVVKSSGKAQIMGVDIDEDIRLAKRHIGVVPQEISLDTFFPLREALEFYAGYYGVEPQHRKTDEIIKALGLMDKVNATAKQLSGGMKRRFLVAKAMVHSPQVLILDEPTAGVDIELRDQLWEYVLELKNRGTTVILTTHYLAEAEELCDHIAFINHGRIIKCDTKENLLSTLGEKQIEIELVDQCSLPKLPKIHCEKLDECHKVRVTFHEKDHTVGEVLAMLHEKKVNIKDLSVTQPDLEKIFKKVIGD